MFRDAPRSAPWLRLAPHGITCAWPRVALEERAQARIGDPDKLIARSTSSAVSALSPVVEAIARAAPDGASAVDAAVKSFRADPTLHALLAESGAMANLAGQMHVRLVELHGRTHLLDDGRPEWLDMQMQEAVDFWEARGGDPDFVRSVLQAYRRRAANATDEMLDVISQRAVDALQKILDDGGSASDFVDAVRSDDADLVNLGVTPASDSYLDLVFQTQVMQAYGAGRWAQMTAPDVIAARPYRQALTAEDERVRPEHRPIDRVVWRADDPTFAEIASPFAWRCRCLVRSQGASDVEGIPIATEWPAGFELAEGFGASSFDLD